MADWRNKLIRKQNGNINTKELNEVSQEFEKLYADMQAESTDQEYLQQGQNI